MPPQKSRDYIIRKFASLEGLLTPGGTITKTIGVGQDFETFEEAQTYLETNTFNGNTTVILDVADTALVVTQLNDYLIVVDESMPSIIIKGTDQTTTILNIAKDAGSNYLGAFLAKDGAVLKVRDIRINETETSLTYDVIQYDGNSYGQLSRLTFNGGEQQIVVTNRSSVTTDDITILETTNNGAGKAAINVANNSELFSFGDMDISKGAVSPRLPFALYVASGSEVNFSTINFSSTDCEAGIIAEYGSTVNAIGSAGVSVTNATYGIAASSAFSRINLDVAPTLTTVTTPYTPATINVLQNDYSIITINPTEFSVQNGFTVHADGTVSVSGVTITEINDRGDGALVTRGYIKSKLIEESSGVGVTTFDFMFDTNGYHHVLTIDRDVTLNNPTVDGTNALSDADVGKTGQITIKQDSVGGHSIGLDSQFIEVGAAIGSSTLEARTDADNEARYEYTVVKSQGVIKVELELVIEYPQTN